MKLLPMILVGLLTACAVTVQATEPLVGGWRNVENESGKQVYYFAMLPTPVAAGTRFVAVDWNGGKLVCCAVVKGTEVSETTLRDKLDIPGVWVADLTNAWSMEKAPYQPHVFALTLEEPLKSHQFAGESVYMAGGLLLPENSRFDKQGKLFIGDTPFRGTRFVRPLADDDGAVHVFRLNPVGSTQTTLVEVPFGTR